MAIEEKTMAFSDLPVDLLHVIGLSLPPETLGSLFRVNRKCSQVAFREQFWRSKLELDFPPEPPMTREEYRQQFSRFNRHGIRPVEPVDLTTAPLREIQENYSDCVEKLIYGWRPEPPTDPRLRYLQLVHRRMDKLTCETRSRLEYFTNRKLDAPRFLDIEKNPRYVDLLRQLQNLRNEYSERQNSYDSRIKKMGEYLAIETFRPSYVELIVVPERIQELKKLFFEDLVGRGDERVLMVREFPTVPLVNGTLIGIRENNGEDKPVFPSLLISVATFDGSRVHLSVSDKNIPLALESLLRGKMKLRQIQEIYHLPFNLRWGESGFGYPQDD